MTKNTSSKNETLANRLAMILTKFNNGHRVTVHELAEEFSTHPKTIRRDIERLRLCNFRIEDDDKEFFLDPTYLGKLTVKDIHSFARISGIKHLYPNLDVSFIRELLDSRVYDAKGYFVEDASKFKSLFEIFGEAISKHQIVAFEYKNERREVEPYKLVHHHGSWYLAAVNQGELRAYRLSRIKHAEQPQDTKRFQPDAKIIEQLKDEESIWFGQEKFEVVLTVHPDVAMHFQQRQLLPEQQTIKKLDDGGLLISSRITHTTQILPLVRYWIPHLKIVNPAGLQDGLEKELKGYLEL